MCSNVQKDSDFISNKWEILLNTRLFGGELPTSPCQEVVTVPTYVRNLVDDMVNSVLHKVLYDDSYENAYEGIQALELVSNRILSKLDRPIVRIELYVDRQGLDVVINLKYKKEWLEEMDKDKENLMYLNHLLEMDRPALEDSDEDKIRRRTT